MTPNDVAALIDVAALYRVLQRYDEAEAAYRQALQLKPDNLALQSSLGDLYLERGQPQEAAAFYEQVLAAADPQQNRAVVAQAQDQLSKAYLRLGQVDRALATARTDCCARVPVRPRARGRVGQD